MSANSELLETLNSELPNISSFDNEKEKILSV
jgi:hypothetical protein